MNHVMTQPPVGIGHNSQDFDLAEFLNPERLLGHLQFTYADRETRAMDLRSGYDRFAAKTADGITDDETQAKAGDFVKQLTQAISDIDRTREDVKAPVLAATRVIDGYFKRQMVDPLEAIKRSVAAGMNAYLAKKQAEIRQQREAEARRQQEEATRLAALAERDDSDQATDRAIAAEQAAMDATAAAQAPVIRNEVKVRSDLGTTVGTRTKRVGKVIDLMELIKAVAAGKAPSNLLMPNKAIIDAMARDRSQTDLPGLVFENETTVAIR